MVFKPHSPSVLLTGLMTLIGTSTAITTHADSQWQGQLTVESRFFMQRNLATQANTDRTLAAQLRYENEWNGGNDFVVIIPKIRINSDDNEQNRFDFESFSWTHQANTWSSRIGVRTVTWQVAESIHLVDIINQVDASNDIDGEDKLGELMFNFVQLTDWGNVELLVMPGFRERVLPGEPARLRAPIPFDTDDADYESSEEQKRTDVAARITWIPGDWEFSLSHFSGTSREPKFNIVADVTPAAPPALGVVVNNVRLKPEYRIIDQTGLTVQYAAGNWLWKAEAISNQGFEDKRYAAAVAGFEFTWSGLGETGYDLGILGEALWDEREEAPFQNDVFVGARLGLNDIAGTSVLIGAVADTETGEYLATTEASRRFGSKWRGELEVRAFGGDTQAPDFEFIHNDDFINFKLTRYF